jgi:antitoxin component of MazEF toxin-antitoxin module
MRRLEMLPTPHQPRIRTIFVHGGSLAMTIPADWARILDLHPGNVTLLVLGGRKEITITKHYAYQEQPGEKSGTRPPNTNPTPTVGYNPGTTKSGPQHHG